LFLFFLLKSDSNYDIAIVGGGIVGLATARKLIIDYPQFKFVLVEKENSLGLFCLD
jgi:L-2-hydroxyglutarate oxidase LhgO